ncbi:uncharacterized protein LOC118200020 [Stegodyphus dumicola]|uniref:uncharacterized protein LOC118200020 n=1 Tax=Stegodyphus dumicola TaxID=202533 RepID=UPI0015AC44D2|nr:uncharacterized protein LOC118200020 [Stegodyphus dumicola]
MNSSVLVFCCVVAVCLLCFCGEARYAKRDAGEICSKSTPCGWEVYRPVTRTIEYFIASPCKCPNGSRCTRSSDDISISAYVHRCIPIGVNSSQWNYSSNEE